MKVYAVIGANYGDEGKGLVSGCLAREANAHGEKVLTVFYNGTMQRAHTFEGHVHHATAAGTKYGSDTFYHKNFVIDPIMLYIHQAKPIIDGNCRVILPCDVESNRLRERSRGAERHGSCGLGLFDAVKRDRDPHCRVRVKDLLDQYALYYKVKEINKKYSEGSDDLYNMDFFMKAASYIVKNCRIGYLWDVIKEYDTVIFEGGQGLMLDQGNMDCFPHLTPSSTGLRGIADDINKIHGETELFYVTRSYLTRHGAGPLDGECAREDINPDITDNTNVYNEWQGGLRYGRIDVNRLRSRILADAKNVPEKRLNLVVTHMNYTDHKLETVNGRSTDGLTFADNIYVSDQKDQMSLTTDMFK